MRVMRSQSLDVDHGLRWYGEQDAGGLNIVQLEIPQTSSLLTGHILEANKPLPAPLCCLSQPSHQREMMNARTVPAILAFDA